jgi:hypothetical protein
MNQANSRVKMGFDRVAINKRDQVRRFEKRIGAFFKSKINV